MANNRYNKQVTPKGYKSGGRAKGLTPEVQEKAKSMTVKPLNRRTKKAMGGSLKSVPAENKGLKKLPTEVRNKMGYMKKGGKVKAKKSKAIHPLDHPDVKMTQKMYAKNKIYAGTKEEVAKNLDKIQNKIAKKRTKTEGSS